MLGHNNSSFGDYNISTNTNVGTYYNRDKAKINKKSEQKSNVYNKAKQKPRKKYKPVPLDDEDEQDQQDFDCEDDDNDEDNIYEHYGQKYQQTPQHNGQQDQQEYQDQEDEDDDDDDDEDEDDEDEDDEDFECENEGKLIPEGQEYFQGHKNNLKDSEISHLSRQYCLHGSFDSGIPTYNYHFNHMMMERAPSMHHHFLQTSGAQQPAFVETQLPYQQVMTQGSSSSSISFAQPNARQRQVMRHHHHLPQNNQLPHHYPNFINDENSIVNQPHLQYFQPQPQNNNPFIHHQNYHQMAMNGGNRMNFGISPQGAIGHSQSTLINNGGVGGAGRAFYQSMSNNPGNIEQHQQQQYIDRRAAGESMYMFQMQQRNQQEMNQISQFREQQQH